MVEENLPLAADDAPWTRRFRGGVLMTQGKRAVIDAGGTEARTETTRETEAGHVGLPRTSCRGEKWAG